MDAFARAFEITHNLLENSPYRSLRKKRYASFDRGEGARFEKGELTLEDLRNLAGELDEPEMISGKQELYESIINQYIR